MINHLSILSEVGKIIYLSPISGKSNKKLVQFRWIEMYVIHKN